MPISFRCPGCEKKLKAPEHLAGRKTKCPGCQTVVTVPARESPPDIEEEQPDSGADPLAADDPFAGDWMNSDALEDPHSRRERAATRRDQFERKQAELAAEEEAKVERKKKSKSLVAKIVRPAAEESEPFRYHWVYLLALLPLALSMFWSRQSFEDRFQRTLEKHPEILEELEAGHSAIEGALLSRDSLWHWVFGLIAVIGYLGLLFAMFPGSRKRTFRLISAGVFTGTAGILLLLLFQFIASVSLTIGVRGHGVVVALLLIVQFIGFSYRCALDPTIGFWGSFFGFTFGVGLCEELCKSLPIWFYLRTFRRAGWRGACLIGLASGIGFGVSEAIMYAGSSYNGLGDWLIYVVRFASCVSLHAMWSGCVGLLMYRNQDFLEADEWGQIILGLAYYLSISMILHGLYDTLLKQEMEVLALCIGVGTYFWLYYQIRASRGT